MMTPFIFAQLLKDPNRQEECFKRFIEKNRSKFDETISIRFSTKKYEEVDVSAFFYKDFKEFYSLRSLKYRIHVAVVKNINMKDIVVYVINLGR